MGLRTNRSAMARCMSMACIRVPALRRRFSMMVSTVMLPTAEITIIMLYVMMVTMWPSLNRNSYGRLFSSNTDALVTLSVYGTPGHEATPDGPATAPLVTDCRTVRASESITSMVAAVAAAAAAEAVTAIPVRTVRPSSRSFDYRVR